MAEQLVPQDIKFEQNTEYLVFHNIEQCSHRNALARWPLHITIVPPFRIPATNEEKLMDLVREIASDYTPILLRPGPQVKFGPSGDIPASTVIDKTGELKNLHERLMWDLGSVGCYEVDTTYANENYSPHYTWIRGVFPPTRPFSLDTLSIARKADGVKTMLETTRLEF